MQEKKSIPVAGAVLVVVLVLVLLGLSRAFLSAVSRGALSSR